jgi:hypothetical protein
MIIDRVVTSGYKLHPRPSLLLAGNGTLEGDRRLLALRSQEEYRETEPDFYMSVSHR